MKYFVKQAIRAAGIVNRHDLFSQNWSPRKVMDLYLGVMHLYYFPCLSNDKARLYETISRKKYFNALTNGRAKYLGSSDGMSQAGGIGLVLQ